jgi:DNA-directed RNA polymerase sigma subunit (sigma70/sigma32)
MTHAAPTPDLTQLTVGDLVWMASSHPVLDEHDEEALVRQAREGALQAVEELVLGNLRIAVDEAIRIRGLGFPQRRLVRLGVAALLEAVNSYDPMMHGRFSEHVRWRVRAALRESVS